LKQFKKRVNSGGKGKYQGGNGVVREFLFLEEVTVSLLTERRIFPAYGLQGGKSGLVGKNIYITS
jgi:5-oxoprolinase (ATP-hydrolysing)